MKMERALLSAPAWWALGLVAVLSGHALSAAEPQAVCALETQHVKYAIGANGHVLLLADKRDGRDYCAAGHPALAHVRKAGKEYDATSATFADGVLNLQFGDSGVRAAIRPTVKGSYLVLEVVSAGGEGLEKLTFVDIPLGLTGKVGEPLFACALSLNLRTNVTDLPRPAARLTAACYPRFGLAGAKAALLVCPPADLNQVMRDAVTAADELPHSPLGGPWAIDQPINKGSYLFNFGDLSEQKVDDWIKLARRLGMNQIDFHGGSSFRFGDCRPNPVTYPRGLDSLKAVIDRLHAAGISAGLHTYAFFIAKDCPWVTPVPDPRLAKDATFTLGGPLAADAAVVTVAEPTDKMSTITGFFVRNSVTLQIDDELITYTGVSKQPPYGFTGCRRGAWGTKPAAHAAGAKVHHLKECFGLFVPDPQTTLLAEVAARAADTYNRCGFDMMYLDALDGEDVLGGGENGWHYGSKFVFDIWKRLQKPALMEMSTFHHHLWYVRSRYCAWDHPNRSHKQFIDIHLRDNQENARMFMPGELGWWALKSWTGAQSEPTFADDVEYLMGKCLGTDTGMAMMGIDPSNVDSIPALPRLANIIRRYEDLRHSGKVPELIKQRLRMPGEEFVLEGDLESGWKFRPAQYQRHRVEAGEWSRTWRTTNKFARQNARLRIEALLSARPYDAPEAVTLADFGTAGIFPRRAAAGGVTSDLQPSQEQVKAGKFSGCLTGSNTGSTPHGAWAKIEKAFSPPISLAERQALGVWVHGDGQQEVLNLQLRSPEHVSGGIGDHYIPIDFAGWRYFELIEPEGQRWRDYSWPYGGLYSIYRESVSFSQVETLGLWLNQLPPGKKITCYLSSVKALPLAPGRLIRPAVTIGRKTIIFPIEIASGQYLEFNSPADCRLFGPQGQLIGAVAMQGEPLVLEAGENHVTFRCGAPPGLSARAYVTVISQGEPLK